MGVHTGEQKDEDRTWGLWPLVPKTRGPSNTPRRRTPGGPSGPEPRAEGLLLRAGGIVVWRGAGGEEVGPSVRRNLEGFC